MFAHWKMTDVDAKLGAMVWEVLHAIAANFPTDASEERKQGYYNFFDSLEYVLPRASWRNTWRNITSAGTGKMSQKAFMTLKGPERLSIWLFHLHDAVRAKLGKPRTANMQKWYTHYQIYRRGGTVAKAANVVANASGVSQIRQMLARRKRPMDEFLMHKYPDYSSWKVPRKQQARLRHREEAARWFYSEIAAEQAKTVTGWSSMPLAQRRESIVSRFNSEYTRARQRPGQFLAAAWNMLPSLQ